MVVVDVVDPSGPLGALRQAAYALHLAVRTGDGRPHRLSDLTGRLAAAGLRPGRRLDFDNPLAALTASVAVAAG